MAPFFVALHVVYWDVGRGAGPTTKQEAQLTCESVSTQQTEQIAAALGEKLEAGSFVSLTGDLGAGKTAFTRGLAKGLGASDRVLSPTFTIERVYSTGRLPLYHFDAYRLSDPDELHEIGFWDRVDMGDGVIVCEWADRLADLLPHPRTDVHIEVTSDGQRRITISGEHQ